MHPASYAEWIALIERYRRAVKAYTEAVQVLARIGTGDYETALQRVEEAHRVCQELRFALHGYQPRNESKKTSNESKKTA